MDQEWAQTSDDVLWRRTKRGLHGKRAARAEQQGGEEDDNTGAKGAHIARVEGGRPCVAASEMDPTRRTPDRRMSIGRSPCRDGKSCYFWPRQGDPSTDVALAGSFALRLGWLPTSGMFGLEVRSATG